jgi:aryl carrier-like protein
MATPWNSFEALDPARRAALLKRVSGDVAARLGGPGSAEPSARPLSAAQESLLAMAPDWFAGAGLGFAVRVADGAVDATVDSGRLATATAALTAAHPVLRARIASRYGMRVQEIVDAPPAGTGLDPATGAMLRVSVDPAVDGVVRVLVHPLAADLASVGPIATQLRAFYAGAGAFGGGAAGAGFTDKAAGGDGEFFAIEGRRRLDRLAEGHDAFLDRARARIRDLTPTPLPPLADPGGRRHTGRITVPLDGFAALRHAAGSDLGALLVALHAVLYRYGERTACLGALLDTRSRPADDAAIGPLSSLSLVRSTVDGTLTLDALAAVVREAIAEAARFADAPYGTIAPRTEDGLTVPPIVAAAAAVPPEITTLPGYQAAEGVRAPVGLHACALSTPSGCVLQVDYDTARLPAHGVRRLLDDLRTVVGRWAEAPDLPVQALAVASDRAAPSDHTAAPEQDPVAAFGVALTGAAGGRDALRLPDSATVPYATLAGPLPDVVDAVLAACVPADPGSRPTRHDGGYRFPVAGGTPPLVVHRDLASIAADALALAAALALAPDDVVRLPPVRSYADLVHVLAALVGGATIDLTANGPASVVRIGVADLFENPAALRGVRLSIVDGPVGRDVVQTALRAVPRVVVTHVAEEALGWYLAHDHTGVAGTGAEPVVLDGDGNTVATGGQGELCLRRPAGTGYPDTGSGAGTKEKARFTAAAFRTGWTVRREPDGSLPPVSFAGERTTVGGVPVDLADVGTELDAWAVVPAPALIVDSPAWHDTIVLGLPADAPLDAVDRLCAAWARRGVSVRPVWCRPDPAAGADRTAFAAKLLDECRFERAASQPPCTPLEVQLAAGIVLPQTGWVSIGRDEDLFVLGVDSFELIELLLAVERRFDTRVDVVSLFEEPTIARLAVLLAQALAERSEVPA